MTGIDVDDDTSASLATFAYVRDPAGQLDSVMSTGTLGADDHAYDYSSLNQLDEVDSTSYTYDAADNLTRLMDGTRQRFNAANELCSTHPSSSSGSCASPPSGATTYAYDQDGNRTTVTPTSGPAQTLGYDQTDRLTSVAKGS